MRLVGEVGRRGRARDVGGVAAGEREGRPGDVGPRRGLAGVGQVVDARGGAEQRDDPGREVVGEGRPADLVVDDGGGDAAGGEPEHGAHEVGAVAHHPGRADDQVPRGERRGDLPGGLRGPVGAQRAQRRVLGDRAGGRAVEHVLAGDVHQRHAVRVGRGGQVRDGGGVGRPGRDPALGRLGPVDGGVGGGVDQHVDAGPVVRRRRPPASVMSRSARCRATASGSSAVSARPSWPPAPTIAMVTAAGRRSGPGRRPRSGSSPSARAWASDGAAASLSDRIGVEPAGPGQAQLGVQRVRCRARRRGGSRWSTGRSSRCRRRARRTRARGPRPGRPRGDDAASSSTASTSRRSASRPGCRR